MLSQCEKYSLHTLTCFISFFQVKIFAPNIEQRDVVNHLKGSPADEKRNVLVESARLARGNIQDLAELKVSEFDAVIFPGKCFYNKIICDSSIANNFKKK